MQLTKTQFYDGGYIFLPIEIHYQLPSTLINHGKKYYLKNEFHISLVCVKRLMEKVPGLNADKAEEKLLRLFQEYTKHHSLDSYTVTKEIRLAVKDDRQTLILMVQLDGLTELFDYLNQEMGTEFTPQPAHITVYTLQPNKGIGILNADELEEITSIANVPELKLALA